MIICPLLAQASHIEAHLPATASMEQTGNADFKYLLNINIYHTINERNHNIRHKGMKAKASYNISILL